MNWFMGLLKQYTVSNNRAFLIKTSHSIYISSIQINNFAKKIVNLQGVKIRNEQN